VCLYSLKGPAGGEDCRAISCLMPRLCQIDGSSASSVAVGREPPPAIPPRGLDCGSLGAVAGMLCTRIRNVLYSSWRLSLMAYSHQYDSWPLGAMLIRWLRFHDLLHWEFACFRLVIVIVIPSDCPGAVHAICNLNLNRMTDECIRDHHRDHSIYLYEGKQPLERRKERAKFMSEFASSSGRLHVS
jgi:hypothetical protein